MAFIDSKLNSRLSVLERSPLPTSTSPKPVEESKNDAEVQRQPAALGKLMEIDLGDEARDRNVKRTDQARRKLDGEDVEDEEKQEKKGKVRLGPDGKPWRSRKRRGSDDVKRDKLVEDVLRENRCKTPNRLSCKSRAANEIQWKYMMSHKSNLQPSMTIKRQMIG